MADRVLFATSQEISSSKDGSGFNGFYAVTANGKLWDGSTYYNGYPASGTVLPLTNIYGPGTNNPVGFTVDELIKQVWRGKNAKTIANGTMTVQVPEGQLEFSEDYRGITFTFQNTSTTTAVRTFPGGKTTSREREIISSYETITTNYDPISSSVPGHIITGYVYTGPNKAVPKLFAYISCGNYGYVTSTVTLHWDQLIVLGEDGLYYPTISASINFGDIPQLYGHETDGDDSNDRSYPYPNPNWNTDEFGPDPTEGFLDQHPGLQDLRNQYGDIYSLDDGDLTPEITSLQWSDSTQSGQITIFGKSIPIYAINEEEAIFTADTGLKLDRKDYWPYMGLDGNPIYDETTGELMAGRTALN